MKQIPLLSVIVPVFNVEEYIDECISSITKQTYTNLEIIIINDGSTDKSLDKIKEHYSNDNRVIIKSQENKGLSSARNLGLAIATGEYITFIDSDDVLLNNNLYEQIMNIALNDKSIDIVQYKTIFNWKSDFEYTLPLDEQIISTKESILIAYLTNKIHVGVCDKIFNREIIKSILFPLNQQSEDVAIIKDLVEKAKQVYISNIGWYGYRYREGSISKGKADIPKTIQVFKSFLRTYDFACNYPTTFAARINFYTSIYWPFLAKHRTDDKKDLQKIFDRTIHRRIQLKELPKLLLSKKVNNKIHSIILLFLGPKTTILLMNIVLPNPNKNPPNQNTL